MEALVCLTRKLSLVPANCSGVEINAKFTVSPNHVSFVLILLSNCSEKTNRCKCEVKRGKPSVNSVLN